MNTPILISVAPNGSSKTKQDHHRLPISPEELAREARECAEAGAVLIHLHVRNESGKHTLDIEPYRRAISAIKQELGDNIIIQVTSEAFGIYSPEQQMDMIQELKPEAVSIALKELIPSKAYEERAREFLSWAIAEKISPQYVLYSAEELARFYLLKAAGVIPGDKHFLLFVLGRYSANKESSPDDLLPFVEVLKQNNADNSVHWSVCAFGHSEAECGLKAVSLGGHIRLGFENNLHLSDGTLAQSNADLVRQFRELYKGNNRQICTVDKAKELILC